MHIDLTQESIWVIGGVVAIVYGGAFWYQARTDRANREHAKQQQATYAQQQSRHEALQARNEASLDRQDRLLDRAEAILKRLEDKPPS